MKSYVYLILSIGLTVGCVYYCNYSNPSVFGFEYPFVTSKLFMPVAGNLCLALFITVLNIFKSFYIGPVNDQEKQHIISTFQQDVIGLFFSVIYLRESFSISCVFPVALWIFLAFSSYLLEARIKTYITMQCGFLRFTRLMCGLLAHLVMCYVWMVMNMKHFLHYFPQESSISLLLLSYSIAFFTKSLFLVYQFLLIPIRNMNLITEHSFTILGIVGLLIYSIGLVINYLLYSSFSTDSQSVIDWLFAYPSFEIIMALASIRKCVINLHSYSQFKSRLESQYRVPTKEDLEHDPDCIICRDQNDEKTSRVMPCGHVFHIDCLKSWIMQKQSCPTCNESLLRTDPNPVVENPMKHDRVQDAVKRINDINRANLKRYLTLLNVNEKEQSLRIDQIMKQVEEMMEMKQVKQYRRDEWVYEEDVPEMMRNEDNVDPNVVSNVSEVTEEIPEPMEEPVILPEPVVHTMDDMQEETIRERRLNYLYRNRKEGEKDEEEEN